MNRDQESSKSVSRQLEDCAHERSLSAHTENESVSSDVRPLVAARPSSLVRVDVGALTHVGHVRTNNEDHFLVTRATRALETMQTSLPSGDVPTVQTKSTT